MAAEARAGRLRSARARSGGAGKRVQHRFQRQVGEPLQFVGAAVLNGVRHPHDRRVEAEGACLVRGGVAKRGGGDKEAGEAVVVERPDVMQTA